MSSNAEDIADGHGEPSAHIGGAGNERRRAPRYPVDTRMFASIDGQTVRLDNISWHGIAIRGNGLPPGSIHLLEINLNRTHLSVAIEILDCDDRQRLHARFVGLPATAQRLVEDYIAELA